MKHNIRPFVGWAGGKTQLLPEIHKRTPPEWVNGRLCEPFVGAGSVFMSLQPETITINDANSELINCYTVIKNDVDELLKMLEEYSVKRSKEDFLEIRSWDRNNGLLSRSPVERAFRFIFLNKIGFNSLYRVNKKGEFNVSYGGEKQQKVMIADRPNLTNVSRFLNDRDVSFFNDNYENILDKCGPGDFVYFDPPYDYEKEGFTRYTTTGFTKKDQEILRDWFIELDNRGCFVLYSNNDTMFIRKIFKNYSNNISVVSANRLMNSNITARSTKVNEVLITNYDVGKEKDLFSFLG